MTRVVVSAPPDEAIDRAMATAVRLAVRGHGRVEPNPMVGCVIVDSAGTMIGWGFHRHLGGPHAEVEALRRAGTRARGATMVVTLEPCSHHGRTPPCTDAIERAEIGRVIYACADPTPQARGGAARLRERGIDADLRPHPEATRLSAPFIHRASTGLPWVSAKWAQTVDGAVAARTGVGRWISSERLRRAVHRERGRVDAIVTGIGTVRADDPLLTPRGVTRRRMPRRVIVDPELETPVEAAVVRSASVDAPVVIAAPHESLERHAARADALRRAAQAHARSSASGAREIGADQSGALTILGYDRTLRALLAHLAKNLGVARLMVEAGGGLLGALERDGLINECWVVIAPLLAGDPEAPRALRGFEPGEPQSMLRRSLAGAWRRGDEMVLLYR